MSGENRTPLAPPWRRAVVMLALLALPVALLARAVSLQVLEGDFCKARGISVICASNSSLPTGAVFMIATAGHSPSVRRWNPSGSTPACC